MYCCRASLSTWQAGIRALGSRRFLSALARQESTEVHRRPRTFGPHSHKQPTELLPGAMSTMETAHTLQPAAARRDWDKKNLIGLTLSQLQEELQSIPGIKSYTAKQIYGFIYRRGVTNFDDMQNLSKAVRQALEDRYIIDYGRIVSDLTSPVDGTRKFLVGFKGPKDLVESVFIPMNGSRGTQCISSQIGCSLACTFCHTGTQKLLRNLTAGEIIGQYMIPAKDYHDLPQTPNMQRNVNNIVFMGQGEPLYNWRNVKQAIEILTDKDGIGLPKAKITVSTSGVAPGIYKLAELGGVGLAISLHAVNNDLRNEIVPINRTFPIKDVLDACRDYAKAMLQFSRDSQRITFEYVMLKDVNDSFAEARELAQLLKDIPSHVNLIPFNPWPGSRYMSSPRDHIVGFSRVVEGLGVPTTIRWPRGKDVLAACGQLRSSVDVDGIKVARN